MFMGQACSWARRGHQPVPRATLRVTAPHGLACDGMYVPPTADSELDPVGARLGGVRGGKHPPQLLASEGRSEIQAFASTTTNNRARQQLQWPGSGYMPVHPCQPCEFDVSAVCFNASHPFPHPYEPPWSGRGFLPRSNLPQPSSPSPAGPSQEKRPVPVANIASMPSTPLPPFLRFIISRPALTQKAQSIHIGLPNLLHALGGKSRLPTGLNLSAPAPRGPLTQPAPSQTGLLLPSGPLPYTSSACLLPLCLPPVPLPNSCPAAFLLPRCLPPAPLPLPCLS